MRLHVRYEIFAKFHQPQFTTTSIQDKQADLMQSRAAPKNLNLTGPANRDYPRCCTFSSDGAYQSQELRVVQNIEEDLTFRFGYPADYSAI